MASTGQKFPTLGSNVDTGGAAWANPDRITASDNLRSTCANSGNSDKLKAQGFDFSAVPDNATITGVVVRVECFDVMQQSQDLTAKLLDGDGAEQGDNKAVGTAVPFFDANLTYGGEADLWGATLTPAVVKDADFGFIFQVNNPTAGSDVNVDAITMEVFFTTPRNPARRMLMGVE